MVLVMNIRLAIASAVVVAENVHDDEEGLLQIHAHGESENLLFGQTAQLQCDAGLVEVDHWCAAADPSTGKCALTQRNVNGAVHDVAASYPHGRVCSWPCGASPQVNFNADFQSDFNRLRQVPGKTVHQALTEARELAWGKCRGLCDADTSCTGYTLDFKGFGCWLATQTKPCGDWKYSCHDAANNGTWWETGANCAVNAALHRYTVTDCRAIDLTQACAAAQPPTPPPTPAPPPPPPPATPAPAPLPHIAGDCPEADRVTDYTECQTAAEELNDHDPVPRKDEPNKPPGCIVKLSTTNVIFNTHAGGPEKPNWKHVCKAHSQHDSWCIKHPPGNFVCDCQHDFVGGSPSYSQIDLTGPCGTGDCTANPVYGSPNSDDKALAHCKSECDGKGDACTAFFYQRHTNGKEICGFYNGADTTNRVSGGHAEGALCDKDQTASPTPAPGPGPMEASTTCDNWIGGTMLMDGGDPNDASDMLENNAAGRAKCLQLCQSHATTAGATGCCRYAGCVPPGVASRHGKTSCDLGRCWFNEGDSMTTTCNVNMGPGQRLQCPDPSTGGADVSR